MKKLSKIVSLLLVVLILTGCVRQKVSMKIKKNGSIEVSAIDAYSSSSGESVSESKKEQYKKNGYKVEDYEMDDYKGVKISKKFKISEVSSDSPVTLSLNDLKEIASPKMFQKTGKNKYKANMVLDASEYSGSGADISYTVTLPSKPISHNADKVEGNTLTWTIDLGETKNVNYEFSLTGGNNVLWIILGIVGVAAVAIVVVIVLNNKNKNNNNGLGNVNGSQPMTPNPDMMSSTQPVVNPMENVNATMASQNIVMPVENVVAPDTTVSSVMETVPVETTVVNETSVVPNPVVNEVPTETTLVETPVVSESTPEIPVVNETSVVPNPVVDEVPTETTSVETPVVSESTPEIPVVNETSVVPNPVVDEVPTETIPAETSVVEENVTAPVSEEKQTSEM